MEWVNEFTLYIISMTLFIFTDYCDDIALRYYAGWGIICLLFLSIIANTLLNLIVSVRYGYLKVRQRLRLHRYNKGLKNQNVVSISTMMNSTQQGLVTIENKKDTTDFKTDVNIGFQIEKVEIKDEFEKTK